MTNDLFNSTDTNTGGSDNTADYMNQLVGEGKKYANVNEAVKALAHAQTFIETLKGDNAHLKNELQSRITMEEFLERSNRSNSANPPSEPPVTPPTSTGNVPSGLSKDEVMQIAIEAMKAETTKATRERNVTETLGKLQEAFGDDYKAKVSEKAKELGVGTEFLSSLAGQSPKAFLELVGANKAPARVDSGFVPPPTRQVSTGAPQGSNVRNKAYYDNLRRTNLNEYLSARVQSQMSKDAFALGEAFYKT